MGYKLVDLVANKHGPTIEAWRAHVGELHDTLIAAGFLQTDDTGQLDFNSVTSIPDSPLSDFFGYKVYEVDDNLSDMGYRIVFRVDYGYGPEGLSSPYRQISMPRLKVTVGMSTDGNGNIMAQSGSPLSPEIQYTTPQTPVPSSTNTIGVIYSTSYKYVCLNPERGFFGVVFACNGRGNFSVVQANPYNASTFVLMIQRSLDNSGNPSAEGFSVYAPEITSFLSSATRYPAYQATKMTTKTRTFAATYSSDGTLSSRVINLKQGMQDVTPASGKVQVSPCYIFCNGLRLNPNLVTHRSDDFSEGTQFEVETAPGVFTNFISLGPGTGMFPDLDGQLSSYAMLFEDTNA